MFVNKAINAQRLVQTRPSSREAAKNISGVVGEALTPVFTHKISLLILSTKNLAIVKKGCEIIQVARHNFMLRSAHGPF